MIVAKPKLAPGVNDQADGTANAGLMHDGHPSGFLSGTTIRDAPVLPRTEVKQDD